MSSFAFICVITVSFHLCLLGIFSTLGSPWWPVSGRLRPPVARQQSLPDPLWLKCGEECSRWWWQHPDGPCAVAVAGQYLFSPNEMQYEGESGPPVVKERECVFLQRGNMVKKR